MRWWSEHLQIVATSRLFPGYTYAWFVMWILSRFLLVTYIYWCQHMYMVGRLPHFLFTISNLLNCYIVESIVFFFWWTGWGGGGEFPAKNLMFKKIVNYYSGIHFSCVAQQDFVHNTILVPRISTLFLVNYQSGVQTYHFVLTKYTSVS